MQAFRGQRAVDVSAVTPYEEEAFVEPPEAVLFEDAAATTKFLNNKINTEWQKLIVLCKKTRQKFAEASDDGLASSPLAELDLSAIDVASTNCVLAIDAINAHLSKSEAFKNRLKTNNFSGYEPPR